MSLIRSAPGCGRSRSGDLLEQGLGLVRQRRVDLHLVALRASLRDRGKVPAAPLHPVEQRAPDRAEQRARNEGVEQDAEEVARSQVEEEREQQAEEQPDPGALAGADQCGAPGSDARLYMLDVAEAGAD